MYLNKIFIIGNLTKDPEIAAIPGGTKVCSMTVATNKAWKDKEGATQETAEFHNVVIFGNKAETCHMYLKKGQTVLVEGRVQTRSWDTDGGKRYKTEIISENIQFGSKN